MAMKGITAGEYGGAATIGEVKQLRNRAGKNIVYRRRR